MLELVKNVRELILPFGKIGNVESLTTAKKRARKQHLQNNPILPNAADLVQWVLWDTLTVAASTAIGAQFTFFTVPQGSGGKTKMQTNLEQVQRLPDPQWFNCVAMGIEFGPSVALADFITVINNYYLEFWVGGKIYAEGRITAFPAGIGIQGAVSTTQTTTTTAAWTNGWPSTNNVFDLRLPQGIHLGSTISDGLTGITILQGQQFKVVGNAPGGSQSTAAGTGLNLVCNLYGMLSRGVQ